MKKVSFLLPVLVLVTLIFGAAGVLAAPAEVVSTVPLNLGPGRTGVCEIYSDGSQKCYEYKDPQYTDPTYTCPEGSTPIEGDKEHCFVDTSGYVYTDRPIIPATYKCPDGYAEVQGGEKACASVDVAGHFQTQDQPYTDETTCPGPFFWSFTYAKPPDGDSITYTSTVTYDKSSDPNKCHRRSDNIEPGDAPGPVHAKFNTDNPEFLDSIITRTYQDCSTLGAGWETDPAVVNGCRKWVDSTYTYADKVVDVAEHLGDCPDGYTPVDGSDTSCQRFVEGGQNVDIIVTPGTAFCSTGNLVDGKCKVEIDCPELPTPTNTPVPTATGTLETPPATSTIVPPPATPTGTPVVPTDIPGCMIEGNPNFDPSATIPDKSKCYYPPPGEWCSKLLEGRPDQPNWKENLKCVQWMRNSGSANWFETLKLFIKGLFVSK